MVLRVSQGVKLYPAARRSVTRRRVIDPETLIAEQSRIRL